MPEYDLSFSPSSSDEAGSYKLIELTPDLTALIEGAIRDDTDLRFFAIFEQRFLKTKLTDPTLSTL